MGKDEIDEELAGALKQAKNRRMYFAFVVKGGADGALIVSKQKVPPTAIAEAKKKCGGSAVIKGACFGEDGKLVFETAKAPAATLANALKLVARRESGLTIAPVCRVGTNPDLADDDAAPPGAVPAAASSPSTAQSKTAAPGKAAAKPAGTTAPPAAANTTAANTAAAGNALWDQKLASLTPTLKTALAAGGETANRIKADFAAAQGLAQKTDYPAAIAKLDQLADALREPPPGSAKSTPPTGKSAPAVGANKPAAPENGSPAADRRADLIKRLNALAGDLKKAIAEKSPQAADLQARFAKINGLVKSEDFDEADGELTDLEDSLSGGGLGDVAKGSPVAPIWQTAHALVAKQFTALQGKLAKTKDDHLVEISHYGLKRLTKKLDAKLDAALSNFDEADPAAKDAARGKLQPVLVKCQKQIETDPILELLDDNPFGVSVTAKTMFKKALRKISLASAP